MAMAIALPILISAFGFSPDALLPVMGFLIGVMKGATVGGSVPAILFNTPGTPDAMLTTLDGYPMAKKGQAARALSAAFTSSLFGGLVGAAENDQPGEPIIFGNRLVVTNFDVVTGPDKVNTAHDKPYTISVIELDH